MLRNKLQIVVLNQDVVLLKVMLSSIKLLSVL